MERVELARLLGGRTGAQGSSRIVVAESDPQKFIATVARALASGAEIFLGNPDWGAIERNQLDALPAAPAGPKPANGYLMIPTGGTSGRLRFARHDAATVSAAVRGFTRHFELPQVNAVGVLPLYHVSGFMAWMRCVLTGGEYRPANWKAIEGGAPPALPAKMHGWTLSLVPTQLERLLRDARAIAWLQGFRIIFLGGAPAWPALLDRAAALRLPLSPGYGMTETAAMIAALRPEEFLAGLRSNGTLLPQARVRLDEEGGIHVAGASLFRGYYPAWREGEDFATQDGGWLDERGHLHVTGRRDAVIISGGEKVNPAEVEAVLRGTGEFADVMVFGVPDTEWGESVVAAYPAEKPPVRARVDSALAKLLSPAKRPKRFVPIAEWPVNAQGKVNRAEVARRASESGIDRV